MRIILAAVILLIAFNGSLAIFGEGGIFGEGSIFDSGEGGHYAGKNDTCTYVVKPYDSLEAIAFRLIERTKKFYEANKKVIGPNPDLIQPGQKLTYQRYMCFRFVPDTYKVKKGDTLKVLSEKLEIHESELVVNNRNKISNGQFAPGTIINYHKKLYPAFDGVKGGSGLRFSTWIPE